MTMRFKLKFYKCKMIFKLHEIASIIAIELGKKVGSMADELMKEWEEGEDKE